MRSDAGPGSWLLFFHRDRDGETRGDFVLLGEVALVEREGDASAGVDVQEGAAYGYVAEGLDEGDGIGASVEGEGNGVAEVIAEFGEGFSRYVEDDVAEGAVEAEDLGVQACGVDSRVVDVEPDEFGDVERGAGLDPVLAAGDVRSGGREDVAAVEGGGETGTDHPGRVCDLSGVDDLVWPIGGQEGEEAVVREDEVLAAAGAGEEAGAFGDVVGRDLVGDVDDADTGIDANHDGLADADGVVLDVEVCHK